jgi:hypothetical protein
MIKILKLLFIYLHSPFWQINPPEHEQLDEQKPLKVPELAGQLKVCFKKANTTLKFFFSTYTCILHFDKLNHLNMCSLKNKNLQ